MMFWLAEAGQVIGSPEPSMVTELSAEMIAGLCYKLTVEGVGEQWEVGGGGERGGEAWSEKLC